MDFSKIQRRIRQPRTLSDKLKVIEEIENNPSETKTHIAKRLGIAPSTLNTIYAGKHKIRERIEKFGESSATRKSSKESSFCDLEEIVFAWYLESSSEDNPISGLALATKAKEIAASLGITNFSASNGWLNRFKERHGIIKKHKKEKEASLDDKYWNQGLPTMVNFHMVGDDFSDVVKFSIPEDLSDTKMEVNGENDTEISEWLRNLPTIIGNKDVQDIYSLHETGIYYNCLPDSVRLLKVEKCEDGKWSKDRLSVLLCTNSDGSDKLPPVVIGKSPKPRCFKHLKTLPTTYFAHQKVWLTKDIFSSFLTNLDVVMEHQNRQILLFLQDCDLHQTDVPLKNIKLIFFPSSYSAIPQPMEDIIRCFKVNYRKQQLLKTLSLNKGMTDQPSRKINVLQSLHLIVEAWNKVSENTVLYNFKRSFPCLIESDIPKEENVSNFEEWGQINAPPDVDFSAYVDVDDGVFTSGIESFEPPKYTCIVNGTDGDGDKEIKKEFPNFSDAAQAFQTLKTFLYSYNLTESDKTNVENMELLLNSFNMPSE